MLRANWAPARCRCFSNCARSWVGSLRSLNRRGSTQWRPLVSADLTADETPATGSRRRFAPLRQKMPVLMDRHFDYVSHITRRQRNAPVFSNPRDPPVTLLQYFTHDNLSVFSCNLGKACFLIKPDGTLIIKVITFIRKFGISFNSHITF